MLEDDRLIFDKSINEYAKDVIQFIQTRLSPHEYSDSFTITKGIRNGKPYIQSAVVHIKDKQFEKLEYSGYFVKIREKVYPAGDSHIFTKKYSYEIYNENDLIRFDYSSAYTNFPNLHINADEQTWGNHLTFPGTTNLDLEKLDIIKALNIFQKYATNPQFHILDQKNNKQYVSIIYGGN